MPISVVADADNVKGVVLVFLGFSADLATFAKSAQSRFSACAMPAKTVVVYTPHLNMSHYFVATAADRIIAPLSAEFTAVGLSADVMHYKSTGSRRRTGDVIRVSPYKTAFNQFVEAEITPEEREQIDWLLDDRYDFLTAAGGPKGAAWPRRSYRR